MSERMRIHRKREKATTFPLLQNDTVRDSSFASQQDMDEVPSIVHEVLSSTGEPLDSETRTYMEPRFGHDFSQVRVHTDEHAVESAQAVNALAYTVGRDVVFGEGQYAPGTDGGRRLIAHELKHVVQADRTSVVVDPDRITPPNHPSEQQADAASHFTVAPTLDVAPVGLALQRDSSSAQVVTFGEEEALSIKVKPGSQEAGQQRDRDILHSETEAITRGLGRLTMHQVRVMEAVKTFEGSATNQIKAMEGAPSGYYDLLSKLFDTVTDVLTIFLTEGKAIETTIKQAIKIGASLAKPFSTVGQKTVTQLGKKESENTKEEATSAMQSFSNAIQTSEDVFINDIQTELEDLIKRLSIENAEIEGLLAAGSVGQILDAIGIPDPKEHSPYGPVLEVLEVEFADWMARQPFRKARGSFWRRLLPGIQSAEDEERERREEEHAAFQSREAAREQSREEAQKRHQPRSE